MVSQGSSTSTVVRIQIRVHVYSRTQGHFRGPSPQDVALRGVMQALVRIQAMLVGIVVAIPAVDLSGVRAVARVWSVLPGIRSFSELAAVYPPKTHMVLSANVPFSNQKGVT
jgi:hypothetical protein